MPYRSVPRRIGDENTYIEVDTVNNKVVIFVNGVKVVEWS